MPTTRIYPIHLSFVPVAQIEMQNLIKFGHLMPVDLQIKRLAEFPKDISCTLSSLEYIGFSGINTTGGAKYGYLNVWKDNTLLVFFSCTGRNKEGREVELKGAQGISKKG